MPDQPKTLAFRRPFTRWAAEITGLTLKDGHCPLCQKPVNIADFTTDVSLREYGISGMCPSCQDEVFKPQE